MIETLDQEPIGNARESLLEQNRVHIRIDRIDYGGFRLSNSDAVVIAFGSKSSFMNHLMTIQATDPPPNKVWSFNYRMANKSSFVIVLYKYKFFGKNEEIGEIELKLSGFYENKVTTHTFPMRSRVRGPPPSITLTVHVSEDQAEAFDGEKVTDVKDFVVVKNPFFIG